MAHEAPRFLPRALLIALFGVLRVHAASPNRSPSSQSNLSARSSANYGGTNSVGDPGISAGYKSSVAANPFMRDSSNFQLPGAPRPPDAPAFGGGGRNFDMNQFIFGMSGAGGGGGMGMGNGGMDPGFGMGGPGYGNGGGFGFPGGRSNFGFGGGNNFAPGGSVNGYRPPNRDVGIPYGGPDSGTNVQNGFVFKSNDRGTSTQNSGFTGESSAYTARKNCNPESYPSVQGYCALRNQLKRKCKALASSISADCSGKELCCFNPADITSTTTTTSTISTVDSRLSAPVETTVASDVTASSQTSDLVEPDRYCIPDASVNVADGICVLQSRLDNKCGGMQWSSSTNCFTGEMCCYVGPEPRQASIATTTAYVTQTLPPTIPVVPDTTTTALSVRFCSPGSYQSITNGICTSSALIAQSCRGRQISPSVDCRAYEYCCFIADSPTGGLSLPSGSCSPSTNPSVANGNCVDSGMVTQLCPGMQMATSASCPGTQLCCFNPPPATTVGPSTTTTQTTTTSTTTTSTRPPTTYTQSTRSTIPAVTCRPGTPPSSLPNGTCVNRAQIQIQCKGVQIDYSLDCGYFQYCCYSNNQSPINAGIPPATVAPGSCTPDANRLVSNGFCADSSQLTSKCNGIEASTSSNCASGQYCCYSGSGVASLTTKPGESYSVSSVTTVTPSTVTPSSISTGTSSGVTTTYTTARSILTGVTTQSTLAGNTGVTTQSSTGTSSSATGSAVTSSTPTTPSPTAGRACSPTDYPSITSGKCTSIWSLNPQCAGMQAAPSPNCGNGEYCCFSNPVAPPLTYISGGGTPCTPENMPSISTGVCTDLSRLSLACGTNEVSTSLQCSSGQMCCYSITGTLPSVTAVGGSTGVGATTGIGGSTVTISGVPIGQTASTTSYSVTGTMTSGVMTTSSVQSSGSACSPQDYPGVTNGICLSVFSLASQCSGKQAAPSLNCSNYEYCCFGNPVNPPGPNGNPAGFCSPDINPAITNGVCVESSAISTQCNGNDISFSQNCGVTQLCCFVPGGGSLTTTPSSGNGDCKSSPCANTSLPTGTAATPTAYTSVTVAGTTITPVTGTTAPSSTASYSSSRTGTASPTGVTATGTPSSNTGVTTSGTGSGNVCAPEGYTDASGISGTCVESSAISQNCASKQVASSLDCGFNEYCCYPSGPVASSPPPQSAISCIPSSNPSINNGFCVDPSQVSSQCAGGLASRSFYGCPVNQLCCYGITQGSGTTTPNSGVSTSVTGVSITTSGTGSSVTASGTGSSVTTGGTTAAYSSPEGYNQNPSGNSQNPGGNGQFPSNYNQNPSGGNQNTGGNSQNPGGNNQNPGGTNQTSGGTSQNPGGNNQNPVTTPQTTSSGATCTPEGYAGTGVSGSCLASAAISQSCADKQVGSSLDCGFNEYCCYPSGPATQSPVQTGPSCIPASNPSINNGFCVDPSQLSVQCAGGLASRSFYGCPVHQMCCYGLPRQGSVTASTGSTVATGASGGSSVAPGGTTIRYSSTQGSNQNPGTGNQNPGTGNQNPGSNNQNPGSNNQTPGSSNQNPGNTQNQGGNSQTYAGGSQNPGGNNQNPGGSNQNPGGNNQNPGGNNQNPGGNQQSTSTVTPASSGTACNPQQYPGIATGTCVNNALLSQSCATKQTSASLDCPVNEMCCFAPPSVQSGNMQIATACIPMTNTAINNGKCLTIDQLTTQCVGGLISRSWNCASTQMCCYGLSSTSGQTGSGDTGNSGNSGSGGNTGNNGNSGSDGNNGSSGNSGNGSNGNGGTTGAANYGQVTQAASVTGTSPQSTSVTTSSNTATTTTSPVVTVTTPVPTVTTPVPTVTVTPAPQSSGLSCKPQNYQAAVSGTCVSGALISQDCKADQLAKSLDCNYGEYCCYSSGPNPPSQETTPPVSQCVPTSNPSINNGMCVEVSQLATVCAGGLFSRSFGCSSSQMCCYGTPSQNNNGNGGNGNNGNNGNGNGNNGNGNNGNNGNNNASYSYSVGGTSNRNALNGLASVDGCSPRTAPWITTGRCTAISRLTIDCRSQRMSKSDQCGSDQFCCFTDDAGSVSSKESLQSAGCSPKTEPSVSNGVCTPVSQLSTACKGQRIAKSDTCQSSEFCCFNPLSISSSGENLNKQVSVSEAVLCSPLTEPSVSNGVCTHISQLQSQCRGKVFAKSNRCAPNQFCCFVPPVEKAIVSQSCHPNTQPMLTGTCVGLDQLSSRCRGMTFSKSGECPSQQFCCFGMSTDKVVVSTEGSVCSPKSDPTVSNGKCVANKDLTTQCRGMRLSKSDSCSSSQFCCFEKAPEGGNQVELTQGTGQSSQDCSPVTQPGITNGNCVAQSDLMRCRGLTFAKSKDCLTSQFCCFNPSGLAVEAPQNKIVIQAGQCIPTSDPGATDGRCVDTSQLTSECRGQRLSKSIHCSSNQFCCFGNNNAVKAIGSCRPSTDPLITNGICTPKEQLVTGCQGQRFSKSMDCPVNQFCCFPPSQSDISNKATVAVLPCSSGNKDGFCMNFDDLSQKCLGGTASRSRECPGAQFCCIHPSLPQSLPQADESKAASVAACSPNTDSSITNGICVETKQVMTQCQGHRLAKSPQCGSTQFCCFAASQSEFIRNKPPSGNPCSPKTNPDVSNGVCMNMNQLTTKCDGKVFSKSGHCEAEQFCCFERLPSSEDLGKNIPDVAVSTCSPNSEPSQLGQCVDRSRIGTVCSGLRMAKSSKCASNQFCCFSGLNSSISQRPADGSCSPFSDPAVTNGVCLNKEQLVDRCGGQSLSKSGDCRGDQFCCFTRVVPSFTSLNLPNTCTPTSDPSVSNGQCLDRTQLTSQCSGKLASRSAQCAAGQFCCFSRPGMDTNKQIAGLSACTPLTDPSVTNGVCLPTDLLGQECHRSDQRASRSGDCPQGQWCCFGSSEKSVEPSGVCTPNSDPSIPNGLCVNQGDLASKCGDKRLSKSANCSDRQFCCFAPNPQEKNQQRSCTPNSDPSVHNGVCTAREQLQSHCSGQIFSKSAQCGSADFCCFRPQETKVVVSSFCTPLTAPDVHNGMCLDQNQLSSRCSSKLFSKSGDCQQTQFCCFEAPSTEKVQQKPCTPNSEPSVHNGVCAIRDQLQSQCGGQAFSKSPDCDSAEFCCFSVGTSAVNRISVSSCTPQSEPNVHNGTCVDPSQLTARCTGSRFSKSSDCQQKQFCCFQSEPAKIAQQKSCSPSSEPSIQNGVCTPRGQLQSQCSGQRFSKSSDCDNTGFCCFGTSETSPKQSVSTACTPLTEPNVHDGMCIDQTQLTARCSNLVFSKSGDCQQGQFCCFSSGESNNRDKDQGNKQMQPSSAGGCTPRNDATVNNGQCVTLDQLGNGCNGTRMSTSVNCNPGDFCCFNAGSVFQIPVASVCAPNNRPDISNGSCVDEAQLTAQCAGMTFSRSLNCQIGQKCCFSSQNLIAKNKLSELSSASSSGCSPVTQPDVRNGGCVSRSQLGSRCEDLRFAKSVDCPSDQFCCFGDKVDQNKVFTATCSPNSQPDIRDGLCLERSQLASQCGDGKRFSKSDQCSQQQFCCFSDAVPKEHPKPSGQCSPSSQPDIHNGVCLERNQLVNGCVGKRLSKSDDCSKEQFCCFDDASVKQTTPGCSPSSQPDIHDGVCLEVNQLATQCTGKRLSKSKDCLQQQFCCFDGVPDQNKISAASCTPNSQPNIHDGACLDKNQLAGQCSGMKFSKSDQCQREQFCCFSDTIDDKQASKSCSPSTQPDIRDGICLNPSELVPQCTGKRMAKSTDCGQQQFCCFDDAADKQISKTCSPITQPDVRDGFCSSTPDLVAQCNGKKMARSPDCGEKQFCCFNNATADKQAAQGCSPLSQPDIHDGVCLEISQVASQCSGKRMARSPDCGAQQFCCFAGVEDGPRNVLIKQTVQQVCSPHSNPGASGTCVNLATNAAGCGGGRISTSANCSIHEFCCYNDSAVFQVTQASQCSPQTIPSVTNGQCIDDSSLTAQCAGKLFSRSNNCQVGQKCCFPSSSLPAKMKLNPSASLGLCIPNSEPGVRDGLCLNRTQLQSECNGQRFSKSEDCLQNQFCCFGNLPDQNKISTGSCSPNSQPGIRDGVCLDKTQLSSQCNGKMFSKSGQCSPDQFCCFADQVELQKVSNTPCSPNSQPDIHDGLCLNRSQLGSKCDGKRFSKSDQCAEQQFCCFGDAVPKESPKPSGQCSPSSQSEVHNGVCLERNQLVNQCVGKRISKSDDCGKEQFCCFGEPADKQASNTCSPSSQPDIHDGVCLETSQLAAQCTGKRMSKSQNCQPAQFCCFAADEENAVVKQSVRQTCIPQSNPAANGTCVDTSQLAVQCTGERMSKSQDCLQQQFCCFGDTADENKVAPASCTPNSQPDVRDGTCLDRNQLGDQCSGKRFSKSDQCQREQFCCFSDGIEKQVSKSCSPSTQPDIRDGICLNPPELVPQCTGKQMAKSTDCGQQQFCCFNDATDKQISKTCSPITQPDVRDGFCSSTPDLVAQCNGKKMARSADCGQKQFCCFNDATDKQTLKACSPVTQPDIHDGICLDTSQLAAECTGKRMSKSADCAQQQFCCFAGGPEENRNVLIKQTVQQKCTPHSDPAASGTCVDTLNTSQLADACSAGRISTSDNCPGFGQFCCYSDSAIFQVTPASQCSPQTIPSATNGQCINESTLTGQCAGKLFSRSGNCKIGQKCCFPSNNLSTRVKLSSDSATGLCIPSSQPEIRDGICRSLDQLQSQCTGQRFSKSEDCLKDQFCCFAESVKEAIDLKKTCSPSTVPEITNGNCVAKQELSNQCGARNFAKSSDCSSDQFCCFDRPSSVSCSPVTAPRVTNGTCVASSELLSKCGDLTFAKSANCDPAQFCCFSNPGDQRIKVPPLIAGSCSPSSDPSVTNGVCTDTRSLAEKCTDQRMSKSVNCADNQFCCFSGESVNSDPAKEKFRNVCIPDNAPNAKVGQCVSPGNVDVTCKNQWIAKSVNCADFEFCCSESIVASTANPKAQAGCIPNSDLSVTDGSCVAMQDVNTVCQGTNFAKSRNCGSGQFCCFNRTRAVANKISNEKLCSPSTNPSVNNGVCLDKNELSSQCGAKRFSKSPGCSDNQFCCFDFDDSKQTVQGAGCVPQTAPEISNGVCLNEDQLTSQCGTKTFSRSFNCGIGQMCCFERSENKIMETSNVSLVLSSAARCTPNSEPIITNGVCLKVRELAEFCADKRASPSPDCPRFSWCCFDGAPESSTVGFPANLQVSPTEAAVAIVNPIRIENFLTRSCSPRTEPSVRDGVCVKTADLGARCGNKRSSKSDDCDKAEFCCFTSNLDKIMTEKTCSPVSDPDVKNGFCSPILQIKDKCSDMRASKSADCGTSEFCCFKGTLVPPKRICSPSTAPDIKDGFCAATNQMAQLCGGLRSSKSPDCVSTEFCCFGPSDETKFAAVSGPEKHTCTPSSDPTVHDGFCAPTSQMPALCSNLRSSKSPDCAPSDFCCFNTSTSDKFGLAVLPPKQLCTPNSDLSVHDGQCMKMRELSLNCVDRKAAPSLDCNFGQWCCFGESTAETTEASTVAVVLTGENTGTCSPTKNRSIRNGQCMSLRELTSSCVDRQAGPSEDCEFGTWCCYNDPTTKFVEETTPVMEVLPPIPPPGAAGTCVPNADPTVSDGLCMPTKDLRTRCRNRRVSKSPQCRLGQWCCFGSSPGQDVSGDGPIGRAFSGAQLRGL